MKIDGKLLIPLTMLSVDLAGGAVYAFNALSVTTTLNVKEPLFISSIGSNGDLAGISCPIATNMLNATCTKDVFAGDIGSLVVMVGNLGHEALTVTPGVTASSSDATASTSSPASMPAATTSGAGTVDFTFNIVISQSAQPSNTITWTITFAR